jgi:hypothetical protein
LSPRFRRVWIPLALLVSWLGTPAVVHAQGTYRCRCRDGTYSNSCGHQGACSGHGGIDPNQDTPTPVVYSTQTPTSTPIPRPTQGTPTPRGRVTPTPIPSPTPTPNLGCPVERGAIKSGTDPGAHLVDISSAKSTTVLQMRQWPHPNPVPGRSRVSPYETSVWSVDADLIGYKLEEDSDYHLVLQDSAGHTMIAEIPSPNCTIGSAFQSGIEGARLEFDSQFSANLGFTATSLPVHVTGVGFFDYIHGQHGVAPNGIELHPVLDITFATTDAAGFDLWVDKDTIAIGRNSAVNVEVGTMPNSGFNSPISLSVAQAPSLTASLSNNVLPAPGAGSAFITIGAGNHPTAGKHLITLTATGSGVTRSVAITVNVIGDRLPVERADSQRSTRVVERD